MEPLIFFLCLCIAIQFGALAMLIHETIRVTMENRELRKDRAIALALFDAVTYKRNTGKTYDPHL